MKKVLVTGASRGIGREIAIEFARQKAYVIINYNMSKEEALYTLKEVKQYSDGEIYKADVSDNTQVRQMFEYIDTEHSYLNAIVNNAGKIIRPGGWDVISVNDFNETIKINAIGTYNCIFYGKKLLEKSSGVSHIVNISSTVGENGAAAVIAYGAAKAAVINMTKSFAKEFAPNIVVNSVAPGNIDTDMTRSAGQELIDWVINETPMKRLGTAREVAELVTFLCSGKVDFITGQVIDIDGGYAWGN